MPPVAGGWVFVSSLTVQRTCDAAVKGGPSYWEGWTQGLLTFFRRKHCCKPLGFWNVAMFTDRGSAAVLLISAVAICSAVGYTVLSASFPEAVWLQPEESCLMVVSSPLCKSFNLLALIRFLKKGFKSRPKQWIQTKLLPLSHSAPCEFNVPSRLIEKALIRVRFTPKGMQGHWALPGTLPRSPTPHPTLRLTDHRKRRRRRARESYLRGLIMASDNLHQR